MTQLSTEVKTHAIITYTKVHYLITSEQEQKLQHIPLDGEIEIDGSTVKLRNIADVLTLSKYYETYPDRRPHSYGQPYGGRNLLGDSPKTGDKRGMVEKLEDFYNKHPEKKKSKGYKFLQKVKRGKFAGRTKTYEPKFVFDPKKETWEEFNKRIKQTEAKQT